MPTPGVKIDAMDVSEYREPMTIDEWAALPEDVQGELVDGHLEEEEMPSFAHEVVISFLIGFLRGWLRPTGGIAVASGVKVVPVPTRGRIPDACGFFGGHKPAPVGALRDAPDIIVEVITPTPRDRRRDRITKLEEYARFGARFYWLVDPDARTFEVFELGSDGRYVRAVGASEGSVPISGGNAVLDLDALWAEVDDFATQ